MQCSIYSNTHLKVRWATPLRFDQCAHNLEPEPNRMGLKLHRIVLIEETHAINFSKLCCLAKYSETVTTEKKWP